MINNVSSITKKTIVIICILFSAAVIGVGLLCAVYLLPTEKMSTHVARDVEMLVDEGNYPEFGSDFFIRMHPDNIDVKTFFLNNRGMARDNYTDAIMLGNAVSNPQNKSLLERALQVYRGNADANQPIESLKITLSGEADSEMTSYPRYWHGYLVVLKPLLMLFTYTQIKYLNAILQAVLLIFMLYNIWKKLGNDYAIAMGVSILFTFPFIIPLCMQYSTMTYIMLISSNILLWKWDFLKTNSRYEYFFLFVGIVTCYFDFLTYPIISLGIPLLLLISMIEFEQQQKVYAVVGSSIMWGIGYGGIWFIKWILATWLGKMNVLGDAIEQALYRMSGNTDT